MSLWIRDGQEQKIIVKTTYNDRGYVYLGGFKIPMDDFMMTAEYVLTNMDLYEDDPRLEFLRRVGEMEIVGGWVDGNKRIRSGMFG